MTGVSVGSLNIKCLLYADDIVLLSESAAGLQSMLDRCQAFADRSSFQFSMEKSHIVKFGDDTESGVSFEIMGKEMTEADHYKYLGLILHRSLGRTATAVEGEKMRARFADMKFIDRDDNNSERMIESVFFCQENEEWVAETRLLADADAEPVSYLLNARSGMVMMIDHYSACHGIVQDTAPRKAAQPWSMQTEMLRGKLANKKHLLRRIGCHSLGLDTGTSKLVVGTMCDAISVRDAEIWQLKTTATTLQTEMNEVHRRVLGAEANTCATAVRHELGLAPQRLRADEAALRFRNNLLNLDENNHVVRKLYRQLERKDESVGGGYAKNAVRGYLEPLAAAADWVEPVGPCAAKTKSKAYVAAAQNCCFESDLHSKTTLLDMAKWVNAARKGLPAYLCRPTSCMFGRREKTKFRLGRHRLQCSLALREANTTTATRDVTCKCCDAGVPETVAHAFFACPAHNDLRATFMERLDDLDVGFSALDDDKKLKFLMADDTPVKFDNVLYRYLSSLSASRERWLGFPTAQGVGLRP